MSIWIEPELLDRVREAAGERGVDWFVAHAVRDALEAGLRAVDPQPPTPMPPEKLWYGLAACGCPVAWMVDHPAEMDNKDRAAVEGTPVPVIEWVLMECEMEPKPWVQHTMIPHNIITGRTTPMPGGFSKEPDRIDWSREGCQRVEIFGHEATQRWTPT